jgi:hypothetical protein
LTSAIKDLSPGYVAFKSPTTMRAGSEEVIEVRVAREVSSALTEGLRGSGPTTIDCLIVDTRLTADLSGDDFDIERLFGHRDQLFLLPTVSWGWKVTPRHSGMHELHLEIALKVEAPGISESEGTVRTFTKNVRVRVNPIYSVRGFLNENLQVLLGLMFPSGILLTGLVALWRKRHPKNETAQPREPVPSRKTKAEV